MDQRLGRLIGRVWKIPYVDQPALGLLAIVQREDVVGTGGLNETAPLQEVACHETEGGGDPAAGVVGVLGDQDWRPDGQGQQDQQRSAARFHRGAAGLRATASRETPNGRFRRRSR